MLRSKQPTGDLTPQHTDHFRIYQVRGVNGFAGK